jgi:hypothetical protein
MSWEDEFRGFFWGEGYLGICRNGKDRKGRNAYTVRAQITLRSDDIAMLEDIKNRIGGGIHFEGRGRKSKHDGKVFPTKPYAAWRARSKVEVCRVCDILDGGYLPSKKRREVELIRRYIALVFPPGKKSDAVANGILAEREKMVAEIKAMHKWTPDANLCSPVDKPSNRV